MKHKKSSARNVNNRVLDEFRLLFVFHYHGEGTAFEAITKAAKETGHELAPNSLSVMASRFMKEPLVQRALELKHTAAIQKIEQATGRIVDIAAEEGFTLRELFRNLVPLMKGQGINVKGKPRAVSDYDRIKAMELGAKICDFLRPPGMPGPPRGSTGTSQAMTVEQDGKKFFLYQAEWMSDNDGTDHGGSAVPALATSNHS